MQIIVYMVNSVGRVILKKKKSYLLPIEESTLQITLQRKLLFTLVITRGGRGIQIIYWSKSTVTKMQKSSNVS